MTVFNSLAEELHIKYKELRKESRKEIYKLTDMLCRMCKYHDADLDEDIFEWLEAHKDKK